MLHSRRSLLALGAGTAAVGGVLRSGLLTTPALAADRRGGALVIAGAISLRHFNGAIQSGSATALPGSQIFASPLRFDENWNPQPYLATSWKVSADGRTVTLNLVRNAVFHDGQPVTSEDVAFTIGVIQANHPFKTMLEPVAQVTTPDPHTAVIHLKRPHPALILAMSPALMPILPKHIYGDGKDILTHPANLKPVGCGPFRFVEYKSNDHWTLERSPNFFIPGRPYLDRVVGRIISDSSVVMLGLSGGEVSEAPMVFGSRDIGRARRNPKLAITDKGYEGAGAITWLAFNTRRRPLNDKRVRQAICYAADRDTILRLMSGVAKPATGPIVSSSPFYNPNVELYKYDLARANALLDQAGLPRRANGMRFSLTVDSLPGSAEQGLNIAQFLRPKLKKVGIAIDVRVSPDLATWGQRVSNYDFDMTLDSVYNWGDPVIGVHRTWMSSNIRKGVIWSNTQSYSNPVVDKLLTDATTEKDFAKRKALYGQFQQIVVDDAPVFFIDQIPYTTVCQKGLDLGPNTIWGPFSPYDQVAWKGGTT